MEDSAFVVSMKGSERTLEELISLFSTFFYLWTVAYIFSFSD
jgi:hypothetical protein